MKCLIKLKSLSIFFVNILLIAQSQLFSQNIETHDELIVYDEFKSMPQYLWKPGNWMPDGNGMFFKTNCIKDSLSLHDTTCIKIGYYANVGNDWIGLNWLPIRLSDNIRTGIDIYEKLNVTADTGVKLTFWAKGEKGGEKVKFTVGGDNNRDDSIEFPATTRPVWIILDTLWRQYNIDLPEGRLNNVVSGFAIFIGKDENWGRDTVFIFVDNIQFELE